MKKTRLIVLMMLLGVSWTQAQVEVGVFAFPQITSLNNKDLKKDPVNNNMLTFSGGAGILGTYYLSKGIGLQTGCLYSAQNQKIKSNYTINGIDYEHIAKKRFDYLKFPLMLRVSKPLNDQMNWVVFGGPQLSYLLKYDGGMIIYQDGYYDLPATPSGNNFMKKTVIDLAFGGGIDYVLDNKFNFNAALKVDYGVTDTENKNADLYNGIDVYTLNLDNLTDRSKSHNMTIALMLGVSYKIGGGKYDIICPSGKHRSRTYQKSRH